MSAVSTAMVQLTLTVLTPEQIHQTHAYALHILEKTGVRLDSPRAQQIFAAADGATLDGDRVRLSPNLVKWAIHAAPPLVEIYNRLGIGGISPPDIDHPYHPSRPDRSASPTN